MLNKMNLEEIIKAGMNKKGEKPNMEGLMGLLGGLSQMLQEVSELKQNNDGRKLDKTMLANLGLIKLDEITLNDILNSGSLLLSKFPSQAKEKYKEAVREVYHTIVCDDTLTEVEKYEKFMETSSSIGATIVALYELVTDVKEAVYDIIEQLDTETNKGKTLKIDGDAFTFEVLNEAMDSVFDDEEEEEEEEFQTPSIEETFDARNIVNEFAKSIGAEDAEELANFVLHNQMSIENNLKEMHIEPTKEMVVSSILARFNDKYNYKIEFDYEQSAEDLGVMVLALRKNMETKEQEIVIVNIDMNNVDLSKVRAV